MNITEGNDPQTGEPGYIASIDTAMGEPVVVVWRKTADEVRASVGATTEPDERKERDA